MIGSHWYHRLFTIYSKVFANLFNDITVARYDTSGNVVQQLPVPIAFGPKSKWIRRTVEDSDHSQTVAYQLPRMAYELVSWERIEDGRQNFYLKKHTHVNSANTVISNTYVPVMYQLNFQLYLMAKNADEGFQIMEQILPFFIPDWHVKINPIPEMNFREDCRVKLVNAAIDQEYEGDIQDKRVLTWTLSFEMDVPFYGPIQRNGIIKRIQIDLYAVEGELNAENMANSPWNSRVVITPGLTANGEPTTNAEATIAYQDIDPADNWDFVEQYYTDGFQYKYNPVTGKDEKV